MVMLPLPSLMKTRAMAAFLLPTEKLEDATEEEVFKACEDDAELTDIFYRVKYGDNYGDEI